MSSWTVIGLLALAIWVYLLVARGGFWLARERDDGVFAAPARWPSVVAVVPARNEADVIARSIGSLLRQDYAGPFRVVLVDDGSSDGTAAVAKALDDGRRLDVVSGSALPAGWTGKLWALEQGIRHANAHGDAVDYFLLTDADIGHTPARADRATPRQSRQAGSRAPLMRAEHDGGSR
ncbi:glycosyltransferase [Reyranella sp.]|uniref:glycosyltransferase n=1 Tax=Reyranella sp. TaxID=1929291 RepID=UPI0037849586